MPRLTMAEKPEDLNLPTSIVTKIIKDCLPSSCKVSKEANSAITKVTLKGIHVLFLNFKQNSHLNKLRSMNLDWFFFFIKVITCRMTILVKFLP
jgi:DNA polymerase epsilon subunit 3